MAKLFLVVIFLIDGIPTVPPGWGALQQPSVESCQKGKEELKKFIKEADDAPPVIFLDCVWFHQA